MRILICDDDPLAIEQIHKNLKSFFTYKHIKCPEVISYSCGEDLLSDTGNKDIVFLDIEMPGMNGIYVGNELKKSNPAVIIFIVTSYSEYLDEAMRFHVFRYLSKPLEQQRFFRNMQDAVNLYHTSTLLIPILLSLKLRNAKLWFTLCRKVTSLYEIWRIGWIHSQKAVFFRHTGVLL